MEIIIRTDQPGTVTQPSVARTSATAPEGVLEQASAIGAIDAGPAPTGPGQSGAPPTTITTSEHAYAPDTPAASAGAAPDLG